MNNSDDYKDFKFSKPIKVIKTKSKIKLSTKPIRHKSKTSRNTSRSLSQDIIDQVYERDWFKCIIPECTCKDLDLPHHIFFGIESNRWPNRNDVSELCTLCVWHHHIVHHWPEWSQEIRDYCKTYINNYYNTMTKWQDDKISYDINQTIKYQTKIKDELDTKFDTNNISDWYHTFWELYKHRISLWIAYCKLVDLFYTDQEWYWIEWSPIWKSKKHSDWSEMLWWFILGIWDIKWKQMTYHLPINKWEECNFAKTLNKAPEYDWHTSDDVLERLLKL